MKIPEHLLWPGMTEEKKKSVEKFVRSEREEMTKLPTYDTKEQAVDKVFEEWRENELPMTVWKEPMDMGRKFILVEFGGLRETANNAGYREVVDTETLYKMKDRKYDTIDEV